MRELERRVLLTVLDRKWREHLYEMDYLREGIGLRAMAQRDPLVEYQREGGDMFNLMMEAFMEEVVGYVFHLDVEVQETPMVGVVADSDGHPVTIGAGRTDAGSPNGHDRAGLHLVESGPDPDGPGVAVHPVDDDESEPAALVDEPMAARPGEGQGPGWPDQFAYPAQLLGSGRGRLMQRHPKQGRRSVRKRGRNAPCPAALARSSRCVTDGQAPSRQHRRRAAEHHTADRWRSSMPVRHEPLAHRSHHRGGRRRRRWR